MQITVSEYVKWAEVVSLKPINMQIKKVTISKKVTLIIQNGKLVFNLWKL